MIPKLIRTASFGHAGMPLPATAGVRAIVTPLAPAGTSFASLIYGGCARHTGGGQGQSPPLVRDVRPLLAGLMALPPTGSAAEAGGSGRGRPGTEEMVILMFGYGGGWPFWEGALVWAGMVAFWGLLIWAVYP